MGLREVLTAALMLAAVACGDEEVILIDHESQAAIDGLVLDVSSGIVTGVPVAAISYGDAACGNLTTPAPPIDIDTTDANGRFNIVAYVPLGPIGAGCVRLDSDLGPDYEPLDTAALAVPVMFFQGTITDTARVVVQVRRR